MEKTRLLWPSIRFSGSRRTDQVHIRARWLTADSHRGQIVSRRAGRNDGAPHWSNREAVWRGNFLEAVGQARTGSMSLALAFPTASPKHSVVEAWEQVRALLFGPEGGSASAHLAAHYACTPSSIMALMHFSRPPPLTRPSLHHFTTSTIARHHHACRRRKSCIHLRARSLPLSRTQSDATVLPSLFVDPTLPAQTRHSKHSSISSLSPSLSSSPASMTTLVRSHDS